MSKVSNALENGRLLRRLAASCPGYRLVEPLGWREWQLKAVSDAFPGKINGIDVVTIVSPQKQLDVLTLSASDRVIIFDVGYIRLLRVLDVVLMKNNVATQRLVTFALAVMAWALLLAGESERACVLAAHTFHSRHIRWLLDLPRQAVHSKINAPMEIFLLLHEAAHAIVDSASEDAVNARQYAAQSVSNILSWYKDRVQMLDSDAKESLAFYSNTIERPKSTEDYESICRQLTYQREVIANSPEIPREAACDYVAIIGILQRRFGRNIMQQQSRALSAEELRSLEGILALSARTVTAMTAIALVKAAAREVRDNGPPGEPQSFAIEQLTRQNIVVGTCSLFCELAAKENTLRFSAETVRQEVIRHHQSYSRRLGARFVDEISKLKQTLSSPDQYQTLHSEAWPAVLAFAAEEGIDPEDTAGIAASMLDALPI